MTFGYIGYIWAIFGCGLFSLLMLGTSLFLYALSRRGRKSGAEPTTTVEALAVRERAPSPAPSGPEGSA